VEVVVVTVGAALVPVPHREDIDREVLLEEVATIALMKGVVTTIVALVLKTVAYGDVVQTGRCIVAVDGMTAATVHDP